MGSVRRLAVDGSSVTFDAAFDLSAPPVSVMDVRVAHPLRERTVEFVAGDRALANWAAEEVVGVDLTQSFSCQNGELSVGSGTTVGADGSSTPMSFATWRGEQTSVGIQDHGSSDSSELVALFDAFRIEEVAGRGVSLTPDRSSVSVTDVPRAPSVAQRVEGVGIVEAFPATRRNVNVIPRWAGLTTQGGELFVDGQAGAEYFVLAARTSLTLISPEAGVGLDDVSEALDSLVVEWRRPD